jgi:hypothetical protein
MWSGSSWDPMDANFIIHAGNYRYTVHGCNIKISYTILNSSNVSAQKNNKTINYSLSQNYPNPFNPSTNITFHLLTKAFVSLKIFDVLGREVAVLIYEELSAGIYTRQWNALNMPSGVYFYRLTVLLSARQDLVPTEGQDGQAGSYSETKKLILLR